MRKICSYKKNTHTTSSDEYELLRVPVVYTYLYTSNILVLSRYFYIVLLQLYIQVLVLDEYWKYLI